MVTHGWVPEPASKAEPDAHDTGRDTKKAKVISAELPLNVLLALLKKENNGPFFIQSTTKFEQQNFI